MILKQHGIWDAYVPSPWPDEAVPRSVIFAKSRETGADWYQYNHAEGSFGVLTVKLIMARRNVSEPWRVLAASRDVTRLFPGDGQAVMEVLDDEGTSDCSEYLGRIFQGGAVIDKPVDLVAYAKNTRWTKETSDLSFGGHTIQMDDRSKSLIMGGYISAVRNASWSTTWQGTDGEFTVDAAGIALVFDAMQARINACFTTYASVKDQIDGGTITTTAAIDAAFAAIP
jgi:hypothetical protein